jgi:2-polyprenyl-3-methyl-5-hydroxy-6-metoxy-1,4-benzoquinol methylase
MGSQEIQNKIWGRQTQDWEDIQKKTRSTEYECVLKQLEVNEHINLLDIGCGSGTFRDFAQSKGISNTEIDACKKFKSFSVLQLSCKLNKTYHTFQSYSYARP